MVGIVNADGTARTIVWLGAGALAREFGQLPVAARFSAKYGLRRNTAKVAAQYQPVAADFNALVPAQYLSMPATSGSCVVVTLTPSQRTDQGYRQAYVEASARLIDWLLVAPPERVIFASSTSVYHRDDGGWVDESYCEVPDSFAGKRLLEAEELWLQSDLPVACVRFSGIYGPGRTRLLEQALAGDGGRRNPPVYSNRIHQVDCARVIAHLLSGPIFNGILNATDQDPAPLWEVKAWLAGELGMGTGHLRESTAGRASKRISNQRLLATGFKFQYPSYRDGYREVISQFQRDRAGES